MTFIVLDRDGVINEDSDDYIKTADEWIPIEGSLEAIATLTVSGYRVAVATKSWFVHALCRSKSGFGARTCGVFSNWIWQ